MYESLLNKLTKGEEIIFTINPILCDDEDVLDWYEGGKLKASHVDLENHGCYVDGCDFRIDLDHIVIH